MSMLSRRPQDLTLLVPKFIITFCLKYYPSPRMSREKDLVVIRKAGKNLLFISGQLFE
jgi:hypothetical protein